MKILIIGSGGREHAIAWKVAQSPKAEKIFALPGNPGIGQVAENVSGISVDNHAAVLRFCQEKQIELVIVGPEIPAAPPARLTPRFLLFEACPARFACPACLPVADGHRTRNTSPGPDRPGFSSAAASGSVPGGRW